MGTGEEQVEHSYAVGITVVKLFSIYIFNRYIYEPDNSHFNQRCKKLKQLNNIHRSLILNN